MKTDTRRHGSCTVRRRSSAACGEQRQSTLRAASINSDNPNNGPHGGCESNSDLRKEEVSFRGHRCQSAELCNGFTKVNGKSRFDVGLKYAAQKPACRDI